MKTINVIDLDKTLIPYDSFRFLIKRELTTFNFYIIWLTLIRVVRLLSMEGYKKRITIYFEKKYTKEFFKKFADKLAKDINREVLNFVKEETEMETINVLLSASPNFFVKHLIEKLDWCGTGSYFNDEGNFVHLYGKHKISWLTDNFSKNKYNYNFAISDSSSDDELLSLFEKGVKWE